jgi:hypothetical protein
MPSGNHKTSFSMFLIDNGTLDACELGELHIEWVHNFKDIWPLDSFHGWLTTRYPQEFQTFRAKMRVLGYAKN